MFLGTTYVQLSYHLLDSGEDSKGVVFLPFIALHVQWRLVLSARHQMVFLVGRHTQSLLSCIFYFCTQVCVFIY